MRISIVITLYVNLFCLPRIAKFVAINSTINSATILWSKAIIENAHKAKYNRPIYNVEIPNYMSIPTSFKITIENRVTVQYNISWNTGKWRKAE